MPPTTSAVKVEPSQKALDRIALIASLVSPFVQSPVDLARLSFAIVKLGISLQDVDDRFMPAWQAMLRRPLSLLIPGRNFAVAPIRKSWNASLKEVKDAGQLRGREALCDALEKMLEKEDDWSYDAVEDLIGEEPEEPSDPGESAASIHALHADRRTFHLTFDATPCHCRYQV